MTVIIGTADTGYNVLKTVKTVIPGDETSLFIWVDGTQTQFPTSLILAIEA